MTTPIDLAAARPVMGVGRSLLVLGVLEAFGPLSMDLYMPTLPRLAASLGTSDALAQATMSVCMIGLGVGQLVAGPVSDRYGRRTPLLIGIALFALFSVVCVFAPTIEVLLVARLAQGLAGSAGLVIGLAIARDMYSGTELARLLALLTVIGATAPIVAPVVGGQLALVMDWRGIFWVLAGVGAVLFVVTATGLRETLAPGLRHGGGLPTTVQHVRALVHDRLFMVILVTSAVGGIAFFSYLSMSSFVIQDEFGFTPQLFSLVFAANAIANMAGSGLSRIVVRRLGLPRMYLAAQAAMGLTAIALFVVVVSGATIIPFLALLCLYLFCVGISMPNSSAIALGAHAERAGTAAALLGTASFVIGPIVAPLASLGGVTALTMAIVIGSATVFAMLLAWTVARPLLARPRLGLQRLSRRRP